MHTVDLPNHPSIGELSGSADRSRPITLTWVTNGLSHRYAFLIAIYAGIIISLPSLATGFFFDDHAHRAFISSQLKWPEMHRPWWDLYYLCGAGGAEEVMEAIKGGMLPWWATPELRIAFFRPLSVVTHYVDYVLWPDKPVVMHLHNMLWLLGILVGLSIYYRRIMKTPWIASLALLIYCLDDARLDTVSWIAGRNTLITAFFGICTLLSYDRWRSARWRAGAFLTPVLFLLSLLCSEGAIGLWAHFVAYALFIDRAKPLRRVLSLFPLLLITLSWRVVYNIFGYGARGSRYYVDPIYSPGHFFSLLPERLLATFNEMFFIPANMAVRIVGLERFSLFQWTSVVVLVLFMSVVILLLLGNRELRYWFTATLLISVAACTTEPSTRLLMIIGMSGSAMMAHCVAILFRLTSSIPRNRYLKKIFASNITKTVCYGMAGFLFTLHILVTPVYAFFVRNREIAMAAYLNRAHASFYPPGDAVAGKILIVLNTPELYSAVTSTPLYLDANKQHPSAMLFISETAHKIEVTRPDPYTVRLRNTEGFLKHGFSTVLRDKRFRFETGYSIQQLGMRITVEEVMPDGRPMQVSLTYPPDLENYLYWTSWQKNGYAPFELPKVGETERIPRVHFANYFFAHLNHIQ